MGSNVKCKSPTHKGVLLIAALLCACAVACLAVKLMRRRPPAALLSSPSKLAIDSAVWMDGRYGVLLVRQVLTDDECNLVRSGMADRLAPSTVVGKTNDKVVDNSIRSSDTAWINEDAPNVGPIVRKLKILAALLIGTYESDMMEDVQVVRYKENGQYKHHYDACTTPKHCGSPFKLYRKATLLVYLNDDYKGGETDFPNIPYRVKPSKGDAVLFYNTRPDGSEIEESFHAGLPVLQGEKWIANVWVKFNPDNVILPSVKRA